MHEATFPVHLRSAAFPWLEANIPAPLSDQPPVRTTLVLTQCRSTVLYCNICLQGFAYDLRHRPKMMWIFVLQRDSQSHQGFLQKVTHLYHIGFVEPVIQACLEHVHASIVRTTAGCGK